MKKVNSIPKHGKVECKKRIKFYNKAGKDPLLSLRGISQPISRPKSAFILRNL